MWLAGPTASGKSALAMRLAGERGGTVVCADSMQVYEGLRIVTARPDGADEARVPHALYGAVDPSRRFSVGDWLRSLDALDAPRPWIVTGGTGLYFSALERGLADVPAVPGDVRGALEARLAAEGAPALHLELAAVDPVGAGRLDPADGQRVARALGVLKATGRPLREWHDGRERAVDAHRIVLEPPRPALRERIARRFEAMMGEGAVEEVHALLARDLDPSLPAMKAIGVREIAAMLRGELTKSEATSRAIAATRQYAKRQSTWFRNQFSPDWRRIASADEIGG